jgi:hypothetical protein
LGVGTSTINKRTNVSASKNKFQAKMIGNTMATIFRKIFETIPWCVFSFYNIEQRADTKKEADIDISKTEI